MNDSQALLSPSLSRPEIERELLACAEDPTYFIDRHAMIYDATAADWVPFRLWDCQASALDKIHANRLSVILKARQLGLTWLVLGLSLWYMLFRPAATILIFSRREEESTYLLSDERLRGMWRRLPEWLRVPSVPPDQVKAWTLANGSVARAFPTNAGDSYTASLAFVDEADLVPDLDRLMRSVKPTIDGGGKMILLSRSDKSRPDSEFKRVFAAAAEGKTEWKSIFLPWNARPDRTPEWYAAQRADIVYRTGSDDDLHEQYPETPEQALSARSLDKRIAPAWLQQCYVAQGPLTDDLKGSPAIPGLVIYARPVPGRRYVVGADPAEGNPKSDDSPLVVLEVETGEEVATLAGRFEPAVFAAHIDSIAARYGFAPVMVERNNHGHAVLLWLRDNSRLMLLCGYDNKSGWLSNSKGKALLYDAAANAFREKQTILHTFATYAQLASIEGASLRAPSGQADDRADSYALALCGAEKLGRIDEVDDIEIVAGGEYAGLHSVFGGLR